MGNPMLLNVFNRRDINRGVEEWQNTKGTVLLDVRTRGEYADYHIQGSINIPLDELKAVRGSIPDKAMPIFVYCLSGGRSASTVALLKKSGYSHVYNIDGINAYRGELT